uniref:Uncharacterized protein n=1 Tax=Acrobeloides nanus TaxID=290746 RepID=A0A914BZ03_9BILA
MGKFIKTKNIQKVKDDIICNKLPSASELQKSENNDDDTGASTSKEELPSSAKTTSSMGLFDTFKNFKFNFSSANDKNISEDTKPTNKPNTDVFMGFKFNFGAPKSSNSSVENPQEFNINHSDKSNNDSSTKADEANDKAESLEPVSNKKESLSNFKFSFGAHQTTSKKELLRKRR